MKHKLLTTTAMGAVLAVSSYAYAEGVTLKFFGGLNLLGDEKHDGTIATSHFTTISGSMGSGGLLGEADFDADTGYIFGGAVGYQWDNGLILEVEAAYRRNKLDMRATGVYVTRYTSTGGSVGSTTFSSKLVGFDGDGHISAVSLMANAWYEFDLSNNQWKPYVGGGVGIAWLDMHGLPTSHYSSTGGTKTDTGILGVHGTESGFAWQLGAGIGYEFAPGKQITLDYRYFNGPTMDNVQFNKVDNDIDYDYSAHNIMIGVRLGL